MPVGGHVYKQERRSAKDVVKGYNVLKDDTDDQEDGLLAVTSSSPTTPSRPAPHTEHSETEYSTNSSSPGMCNTSCRRSYHLHRQRLPMLFHILDLTDLQIMDRMMPSTESQLRGRQLC